MLASSACGASGTRPTIRIQPASGLPKKPPLDAVVMAKEDGGLALALAARPASGGIEVTVTAVAPDNTGKSGLEVGFGRGAVRRKGRPCGSGCYAALLPATGPRTIAVRVSARTVYFRLPARWPAPSAEQLVRRATAAYRRLRSVSYVQSLRSSPRAGIVATWKEVAPDRLEYRIRKGPAGVVIGGVRWDKTSPNARWRRSEQQPITALTPVWASSPPTNARLVGAATIGGRRVWLVSLLDRALPAWFTIRFDQGTLRPLSLNMTAAAHFMRNDYTSFNRPLQIRPPR